MPFPRKAAGELLQRGRTTRRAPRPTRLTAFGGRVFLGLSDKGFGFRVRRFRVKRSWSRLTAWGSGLALYRTLRAVMVFKGRSNSG